MEEEKKDEEVSNNKIDENSCHEKPNNNNNNGSPVVANEPSAMQQNKMLGTHIMIIRSKRVIIKISCPRHMIYRQLLHRLLLILQQLSRYLCLLIRPY